MELKQCASSPALIIRFPNEKIPQQLTFNKEELNKLSKCSELIMELLETQVESNNSIEDYGEEELDDIDPLEIPVEVNSFKFEDFRRAIDFLKYHHYKSPQYPKKANSSNLNSFVCESDYNLISHYKETRKEKLQPLLECSRYFKIQSLRTLCLLSIAADIYQV